MARTRWWAGAAALAGIALGLGCGTDFGEEPLTFCEAEAPVDWQGDPPTWHDDVRPLVQKHCTSCHTAGGIAPFSMDTYADAVTWAAPMASATLGRRMPPVQIVTSGCCGTFEGAQQLTGAEIGLFQAWAAAGAPEGTAPTGPTPPGPQGDTLAPGAIELTAAEPYVPSASLNDDYRCFVLDPGLTSDKFLTAFELIPDKKAQVHHMILFAANPVAGGQAELLDAGESGAGYTCFGGSGVGLTPTLAGWAPGQGVTRYPGGTGVRIAAGSKLIMQVHYNAAAGREPDLSRLRIELSDSVTEEGVITMINDATLSLPPGKTGATAYTETDLTLILPLGKDMHRRGRTLHFEVTDDDKNAQCLMTVPSWDFDWQRFYFFKDPVVLERDQTLRLMCSYDTTGDGGQVTFGEGTDDEMCLVGLYSTIVDK